ncbi:hypothetical protein [Paracoccus saliphilus]|uniref:Uncharacterized protein n=1 Tax=Paracoccus saliphilus TaxID=405559 RepID=A0ABY7SDR1_9RHOB|nr:hypothetical protein [Paracoccus saliphilus]WCR04703.1 hypothetical protein JHX88_08295 [Paracoccus saliphilus]
MTDHIRCRNRDRSPSRTAEPVSRFGAVLADQVVTVEIEGQGALPPSGPSGPDSPGIFA